jgi:hypothetical protein
MKFRTASCGAWMPLALLSCLAVPPLAAGAHESRDGPVPEGGGPCAAINGPVCVGADSACQFSDLQDAIDSASESGGTHTTIHVAGNQEYADQRLFVSNRNLTLRGGYSSCSAVSPNGTTTLRGVGTGSVISIDADAGARVVHLENLKIRDGGGTDPIGFHVYSEGGGVRIHGDVAVTIRASTIWNNAATHGGGIYINGGDGAELMLDSGTEILVNSAENGVNGAGHNSGEGGGIYCIDGGAIEMHGGQIYANVAVADTNGSTRGGGVYLEGCSFTATASGEDSGVRLNYAGGEGGKGGGFYVTADADDPAVLELHGTSAGPFPLSSNVAGGDGGGMFVRGTAILDGTAVEENIAGYSGVGSGGGMYLFGSDLTMDSAACPGCSSVAFNTATASGSAIHAPSAGTTEIVTISNTRVFGNGSADGGSVIDVGSTALAAEATSLRLANDLLVHNMGSVLARVDSRQPGEIFVTSTTIADNAVDVVFNNINSDDPIHPPPTWLLNSIVREAPGTPGVTTLIDVEAQCVIAHQDSDLPTDPSVLVANPRFVDPDDGDYHLQSASPAIDFCTLTEDVPDDDLDGNPRGVDAPQVPPFLPGAIFDLGAYEWSGPGDTIFADGFEDG